MKPTHDYVARRPCGCVWACTYDMGDKDTAKTVAEWIADGSTVERLPIHDAVKALEAGWKCQHEQKPVVSENQLALGI